MNNSTFQLPWSHAYKLPRQQSKDALQSLRPCPMCGTKASSELLRLEDFQFFTDLDGLNRADHRVVVCDSCGLLYTNPCYTSAGFQLLFDKAGRSYGHSEGRIQEQVTWLDQHFTDKQVILDVGCGNGDLLMALPERWLRHGIDVDVHTLEQAAQQAPAIHFSVCDFDGLQHLPAADVVTMFHVLEHLANPAQFLSQLRQLLPDNAQLVVEVPVVDRAADEQDRDVVGFFTIQHLTHFSRASLLQMLASSGWNVVHSESMDGYNGFRIIAGAGAAGNKQFDRDESGIKLANDYLKRWRDNVRSVKERLQAIESADKVLVWGAGQHTEYLFLLTDLFKSDRAFVLVDSDPLKQGQIYHGIPVLAVDEIPETFWTESDIPIVISTYGGQESIVEVLRSKHVAGQRIVTLYDRTRRY